MPKTKKTIQQRLETMLTELPTNKLEQVIDFAEYLKSREEWEATMELINDPAMCNDIVKGQAEAQQGKGRSWREVRKRVRS